MRVKPVDPSAVIRDPHTKRALPAEGGNVPENNFWVRRLLDGSVVRVPDALPTPLKTTQAVPLVTREEK